jgi:hypothetical protein
MPKKPTARFLPIIILSAVTPAILMPVMTSSHVPDALIGATMGFSIGLAFVGLIWMVKRKGSC